MRACPSPALAPIVEAEEPAPPLPPPEDSRARTLSARPARKAPVVPSSSAIGSVASSPSSLPSTPSPRSSPSGVSVEETGTSGTGGRIARRPPRSEEADRLAFAEAKALYDAGVALSSCSRSKRSGGGGDGGGGYDPLAATRHFRQAAVVFSELRGQEKRRDKALWQAGMCYAAIGMRAKRRGEVETAQGALEQARSCFHFINEREKEAMAVYQLGLLLAARDLGQAAEYLKAAALVYADLGDDLREAMCYAELGHRFSPSDPDTAIFFLKQCLLLYLKVGDSHREGKVLYTIGLLAVSPPIGDLRTGYNYLAQARVVFQRRGDPAEEADACYQLGKVCVRTGALEQAVRSFEQASTLFHRASLPIDEAWALYRLALVMLKVRSAALALSYLAEARQLFAAAAAAAPAPGRMDETHAEGSCCLRMAEILGGAVGTGTAAAEEVRDPKRAAELLDEAARLLAPAATTSSSPSSSSLSTSSRAPTATTGWSSPARTRRAGGCKVARIEEDSAKGALARRNSTMSVARAQARRKRFAAEAAVTTADPDAGEVTDREPEERERGRAPRVGKTGSAGRPGGGGGGGAEGAWWMVADGSSCR